MLSRSSDLFSLADIQKVDEPQNAWFSEDSVTARAGRCLLDAVEYLRADLKFPGRFRHVTDAHTIRLVCRCLADGNLDRQKLLERLKPLVRETGAQ